LSYSNKSRGLREKQGNLTPDDQPLDETDEAIEIIDVSEYQPRRIPSKQGRSQGGAKEEPRRSQGSPILNIKK